MANVSYVEVILSYKVVLTDFILTFFSICSSGLLFIADLIVLLRCPIALTDWFLFFFTPTESNRKTG